MNSRSEIAIENTGERVIPDSKDMNFMLHLAGYEFIASMVREGEVLDVGCGVGYGSEVLISSHASQYTGVDLAKDAILFAHNKYSTSNTTFAQMDALALGFEQERFDLICSFQVIEHIPDEKRFLSEIARVVKQEGTFIVSTPNRLFRNVGASPHNGPSLNPFHVQEYSLEQLRSILSRYWGSISIWGQILPVYDSNRIQKVYYKLYSLFPLKLRVKLESLMPFSPQLLLWRLIKGQPETNDSNFLPEGKFSIQECRHLFAICRNPIRW